MPVLEPEHLDPESTVSDLPDGYDDDGWTVQEWWDAWDPLDTLRPADFDDEERRT